MKAKPPTPSPEPSVGAITTASEQAASSPQAMPPYAPPAVAVAGYRGISKDVTERRREHSATKDSQHFAGTALDALADHVCVLDAAGQIVAVNSAWRDFAEPGSASVGAYVGANYLAACDHAVGDARANGAAVGAGLRDLLAGRTDRFQHEYALTTPTGLRWFALKASSFEARGERRVVVAHEDITERKRVAARVVQINSLYQALGDTNDAVARTTDRDVFLREVASIGVRAGLFRAATIWMREGDSDIVRAAFAMGRTGNDLELAARTIDLSGAEARGPTGAALLEGRPDVCNDLREERLPPWRQHNKRAGYRSAAAFPLREYGKVIGALSVYAATVGYFDATFVGLLSRIAAAISLGLDNRRRDTERVAAEAALRESEARFRSLTELSADWYWQQDAELRFTSLCNGTEIDAGLAPEADLGKTRWEISGTGDTQWDLHKQTLAARRPFVNFEIKRTFPDGSVRDISISGTPIFDPAGKFCGYRGIGRDITRRTQDARILGLEHRVARSIAAAGEASPVLEEVIRATCEILDWGWGAYFRVDEGANVLRADTVWAQAMESSAKLIAAARTLTIAPGTGICGRVWQTGQPIWVVDAGGDSRLLIGDVIEAAGFRGGFAFPATAASKTIGVFMFFGREVREPDGRLLSAARMVGRHVGQWSQHRQAEDALRESEGRYRALTELSSDWYWEHDENQRFTRMSESVEKRSGVEVSALLGRTRWQTGISYPPAERAVLEAHLDARRPFHDFAFSRTQADGTVRHVAISGEPMFDLSGRYVGYRGIGRDVTERRNTDDRLRFQAMLLNTVGDAVMASDMEETISYWSAAAETLYGWTAAEAIGRKMLDMVRPADSSHAHSGALIEVTHGGIWRGEKVGHRRDGTTFPVHLTLAPLQDADGAVTGMVSVSRDISESKHAEQVIRDYARQQRLIAAFGQRALASSSLDTLLEDAASAVVDGLAVTFCKIMQLAPDSQSLVARVVRGFAADTADRHAADGGSGVPDGFLLQALETVVVDDYLLETRFVPSPLLALHDIRSGAHALIGDAADPFGVLAVYAPDAAHFDADKVNFLQSIANTLATALDRIAAEEKVAYLAQFDALTGVPNRILFHDRLSLTLTQAQRNAWTVGVMFVDLDKFKDVNDTYGHDTGDRLLSQVADRLRDCVRTGDTVGRLGGDEFAVVLSDLARADDANLVAQQIVDALGRPFDVDGHDVHITVSIGISVYPADGDDSETLLKRADAAMYLAKQQGRNGFHFYTEELNVRATRRLELESELRHAIENDEFVLHYQPELSLDTGRIVGVEALIRWQHPVRGLLAPADFIGVAEETGLIVPIGRWVARTASAQVAQWRHNGHRDLFVAINVSPLEIRRGDMAESIGDAIARSGLDPRYLEIEVTETLMMDGADTFVRSLEALKSIGCTIAIDDFGTGYSSLSYLRRFPVDKVKIDRAFIRDIVTEVDDAAIVQAIIAMSHHLKLQVTAEGVETEEQAGFLRRCQCDIVQGYLFGRPVAAAQMSVVLDSHVGLLLLQGPRGSSRSLLLVDDEESNLRALRRVLRRDGYDIHIATSAQQALGILAHTEISVIVSDQRMPGMSGTELLARAKTLYPATVRIMLSGFTDLTMMTAAINEGAIYKVLTKPWEDEGLREDIRGAFRLHEQQGASRRMPSPTSRAFA
ncbi:MAG: EAL domain-containing protein [Betaproteobacteria bacterium]